MMETKEATPGQYLTCRQAADVLQVSESTVKRLCDAGALKFLKTAGGHRRIQLAEILRFRHENEAADKSSAATSFRSSPQAKRQHLIKCLLRGDADAVTACVLELLQNGEPISEVLDDLVTPVMHQIGDGWEAAALDVYEEHLSSLTLDNTLTLLQGLLPISHADLHPACMRRTMLGACLGDERHTLALRMIQLAARKAGWKVQSLGASVPCESICKAVDRLRPEVVFISYTIVRDDQRAIEENHRLFETLSPHQRLCIGGQALSRSIRQRMRFHFFGDTIGQLLDFLKQVPSPV